MTTRAYIPATFGMLMGLNEEGRMPVRSGWGFTVTPALREFFTSGTEDEFEQVAFDEAALASLRLLAIGDEERFPHRRVVVSVDLPDEAVSVAKDMGEAVIAISPAMITSDQVAAVHMDVAEAEEATRKAIEAVDEADLGHEDAELIVGDAQDNYMAFYDPTELPFLIDLA